MWGISFLGGLECGITFVAWVGSLGSQASQGAKVVSWRSGGGTEKSFLHK